MGKSIAICVGEASGDLNGAHLALELKKLQGDLEIWGAGGARMREAGVDVAVDMAGGGTIGIAETLKTIPAMAEKYLRLRGELLRRRPDLFVPIDFGAFNVRLAQTARKNGIPVVYYFPPSSWRKRLKNANKLLACGGKVVTPFPWSAELLTNAGVDARFVGHPLLDIVRPSVGRDEFLSELGLSNDLPTIGFLPGSRKHEVDEHLPCLIECAPIISEKLGGAQFVVGAAWGADAIRARIKAASAGKANFPKIEVVERRTYDCMAASDLLITASGTATLEAAILGVPMVIIYRGSAIMRLEFIMRKHILEDFIGMPNIVADRSICPELICDAVTPQNVSQAALGILQDSDRMAQMKSDLADVRAKLGGPGAIQRAARTILEMEKSA